MSNLALFILLSTSILVILWIGISLIFFFHSHSMYKKVRKIHAHLYGRNKGDWLGDSVNQCVLCPICKGFVYVKCWNKHLDFHNHKVLRDVHYITPIREKFIEASKRLKEKTNV